MPVTAFSRDIATHCLDLTFSDVTECEDMQHRSASFEMLAEFACQRE